MYHPESVPGQYEIVTGPLPPVEVADALFFTREIITQVAAKHGLHATFAPRPFMSSAGSSTHGHISVHSTASEKVPGTLSPHESAFVAGVLDHVRAFAALTMPTAASYKRMVDGVWSGGTYVCWGTENREAPVRLTNAMSPGSRNFEVRFIDGTSNPHLALAGMFAAVLLALKEMKPQALGITKRMPLSIVEARESLEQDKALIEVLGSDFVEKYSSVNHTLESLLNPPGENEEQLLTRLVKYY
ncbi:1,2-dihydroxy-3-keto-5-methylthiopentene dioxygenase [Mycena kentingensis (nom. inval.)]|nr:1,2-dihydroxy-3-keto-5-methylthiopentene dioxygenase [Mycena kentingensis (nom. inval.)]